LTYGSRTGIFANTELPSTSVWQTNYEPTTFTLLVTDLRPALNPTVNSSKQFLFRFTGNTNDTYTILASTNLSLPALDWSNLGAALLLSNSIYQFIDTQGLKFHDRYYILRSP
jgi:hypothetical protein